MSNSLFLAPLLFRPWSTISWFCSRISSMFVCTLNNLIPKRSLHIYAAERSSFANCIQCSCNFLCSSFTNSLNGCTCKLSRSPNAQLRGLDWIFFYWDCFRLLTSWCCFLLIFKYDIYLAPSLWWILCLCSLSPFPGLSEATTGFPRFSFMVLLSQILFWNSPPSVAGEFSLSLLDAFSSASKDQGSRKGSFVEHMEKVKKWKLPLVSKAPWWVPSWHWIVERFYLN